MKWVINCEGERHTFTLLPGEDIRDKVEEVLYLLYAMEETGEEGIWEVDGDCYEVTIYEERGYIRVSLMD